MNNVKIVVILLSPPPAFQAKKQLGSLPSQQRETGQESILVTSGVAISVPGPSTTLTNQLAGQSTVTAHGVQIAAEVCFTTVGGTSYPHVNPAVNTTESYTAVFATSPKTTSAARDITSNVTHDSSTTVSEPGSLKVISPQRRLFVARGDRGEGEEKTRDSAEVPEVVCVGVSKLSINNHSMFHLTLYAQDLSYFYSPIKTNPKTLPDARP